jgi:SAM-dependent MidA family methyltransferase
MTRPYDPEARRDTPLAAKLMARIVTDGPLSIPDYLAACLLDAEHGYYHTQHVLGRAGDFITAPEISQVFGEVLGAWCIVVWEQMGRPVPVRLIELGPGRGTLMLDVLRVARRVPAFAAACDVHLVELSPRLIDVQRRTLTGHSVSWTGEMSAIPRGCRIILANEFLDALPVRQTSPDQRHERVVVLDTDGRLQFAWRPSANAQSIPILEQQSFHAIAPVFASSDPTAALFIDYGDERSGACGDTLQAVRDHRFEHPLTSPGEADLSVQVNFAAVARLAMHHHFAVDGPIIQADFLGRLGVTERAARLIAANPAEANVIETAVARLLAPNGMGTRFKAIGLRSPTLPTLPGF